METLVRTRTHTPARLQAARDMLWPVSNPETETGLGALGPAAPSALAKSPSCGTKNMLMSGAEKRLCQKTNKNNC